MLRSSCPTASASAASSRPTTPSSVANYNFALANTGANAQIGGFQGNGTIQGAGALAVGGWAGALGAFALAKAGDATAIAGNVASNNESTVHNELDDR